MISLRIRHIPLEILHQIHLKSYEGLQRREVIVYKQKLSAEQGMLTVTKEVMTAVQEKKVMEADMV